MVRDRKTEMSMMTAEGLKADILREAKAVKMPAGAAEKVAEKVSERVMEWAQRRAAVTEEDLNRKIADEVAEYSKDLAYIFQQRGKII